MTFRNTLYRGLPLAAALAFSMTAQAQLKPSASAKAPAPAATASAPAPAVNPANAEKENAGRMAAQGWLMLLDRRDWGTAWDSSSAVFRQSVPLPNWMDAIPKVREPFGKLVDRQPADAMYRTSLQGRPDGEYVTVIFQSKFDKQEVREVVTTVRDADGRWRVTGYTYQQP